MAVATMFSRVFGLVREQVMAAYFGASGVTDAFLVAFRIPNLLRDLFAEGAFSSAFVPTFVEANHESKEASRELMWALFWLSTMITGLVCLATFIFAPELIEVFAPAFQKDPNKFHITVTLTRIMSPFLTFVSWAALFMGALNSLKVFFVPSLAPAFFNVVSVICQVGLSGWLLRAGYPPVYSLGIGASLGGLVQAAVQLPLIWKHGLKPVWPRAFWTPRAKKVVKLLGPGLLGFAATQVNLLVVTILASGLPGAVSWLNYSFRLFQLPVGILSVSIGNSNMVHFSEAWKKKDVAGAKKTLETSFYLSFLTNMPAVIILFVCSEEIIGLIYERGKFLHSDTLWTAEALRMYAIGLPFYGLYKIFVPTFYALDRQKIPVYASLFSIAMNIAFCLVLVPIFGFKILALGTTISMFLNSSIQSWVMKKDLDLGWKFFFSLRVGKTLLASIVSAIVVKMFLKSDFFGQTFIMKTIILSVQIFALAGIYAVMLVVLGERSAVNAALVKVSSKFRRK